MYGRSRLRTYGYVLFALIVLIACWESNRALAFMAAPAIPEQSIRFRILAHSDAPRDQWVKRQIRDAIVERMNSWAERPQTIDEARAVLGAHLPELDELVGRLLKEYGFTYGHKVELGIVPFPAKRYGNETVPAGNYEALRVTLGDGKGHNWWCVLFPPLCIIGGKWGTTKAQPATGAGLSGSPDGQGPEIDKEASAKPEIRFFVLDVLNRLAKAVRALFA
jgi:stage II sporulation protein R